MAELIDDVLVIIFGEVDWTETHQKDAALVCTQWRNLLESPAQINLYGWSHPDSLTLITINQKIHTNWNSLPNKCRLFDAFTARLAAQSAPLEIFAQNLSVPFAETWINHMVWNMILQRPRIMWDSPIPQVITPSTRFRAMVIKRKPTCHVRNLPYRYIDVWSSPEGEKVGMTRSLSISNTH